MITKDELRYALLLANGDLEFAYLILDFVSKGKPKKENSKSEEPTDFGL